MNILRDSGLIVFILLIFGASNAFGCTCKPASDIRYAFDGSAVIVVAHLSGFEGSSVAVMTVEKVYKSGLTEQEQIKVYDGGGGDCSKGFREYSIGQRFLLFTGAKTQVTKFLEPLYRIHICSWSKKLEDAKADLGYLDNRAATLKTRLFGGIGVFGENQDLSGIKVIISGQNAQYALTTDTDGHFEIYDLPPGQYKLSYQLPIRWKARPDQRITSGPDNTAVINARAETEIHVVLKIDN
jgi:hypothetical protein